MASRDALIETQHQIRLNAAEQRAAFSDLAQWEAEARAKDSILKEKAKAAMKLNQTVSNAASEKSRIKRDDYRAWDKFDVENALDQASVQADTDPDELYQLAMSEKDLGNKAFQQQDFTTALTHYTRAIQYDASQSVFYTNRAQCHFRLKDYKAAEQDSSSALQLDPKSVKAWYRRALSRIEMRLFEAAKQDLKQALVLEPTNATIRADLKKVESLLPAVEVISKSKESATSLTAKEKPMPERRRLTIREVGTPPSDEMKPVEVVRRKEKNQTQETQSIVAVQPKKNVETQSISLTSEPKPVTDPVKSESAPLSVPKVEVCTSAKVESTSSAKLSESHKELKTFESEIPPPKAALDFERAFKSLRSSLPQLAQYLLRVDVTLLPSLLQSLLDAEMLFILCRALQSLSDESKHQISPILEALTRVHRFKVIVMFLSRNEKQQLQQWIETLPDNEKLLKLYSL